MKTENPVLYDLILGTMGGLVSGGFIGALFYFKDKYPFPVLAGGTIAMFIILFISSYGILRLGMRPTNTKRIKIKKKTKLERLYFRKKFTWTMLIAWTVMGTIYVIVNLGIALALLGIAMMFAVEEERISEEIISEEEK